MASKIAAPSQFALGVALRAIAIGALAYLCLQLLAATHLYATVLVISGVAALLIADLARVVSRADRVIERFVEGLTSHVADIPVQTSVFDARLIEPFERAAVKLNSARAEQHRQLEYSETLLDTVAAALIVLRPDGRVRLINRAARTLAAASVERIEEIAAIGTHAAQTLMTLPPGTRRVIALADDRQMHVMVAQFSAPGREPERLISLQRIAGELDAVEVKAWLDMSRVLAHEMMNSLTPIASLSESLGVLLRDAQLQRAASNEIAGALEAIQRRSHGLMDFVERYRQVLELPQPKLQSIRMDEFLDNMQRLMSASFADRGVAYRSRISPQGLRLSADPQLLEQAIINLLRNAVDAAADAVHPQVEISCELRNEQTIISISDNGRGLTQSEKERIFVPFFTTKPGGSGIGLNLARHVALAHGGRLDVRDNEPRGAAFVIALPRNQNQL